MPGRERLDTARCVRRLRNAPVGFCSPGAARQAQRNDERSASILRALVASHGTGIALSWDRGGMWATVGQSDRVPRQSVLSWERRGWAVHVISGDVRRSRLDVDLDALPEAV